MAKLKEYISYKFYFILTASFSIPKVNNYLIKNTMNSILIRSTLIFNHQ